MVLARLWKELGPRRPPSYQIARALKDGAGFVKSVDEIRETLDIMHARGKQYQFLEERLGAGVCLILGTSISETQYVFTACTQLSRRHAN